MCQKVDLESEYKEKKKTHLRSRGGFGSGPRSVRLEEAVHTLMHQELLICALELLSELGLTEGPGLTARMRQCPTPVAKP